MESRLTRTGVPSQPRYSIRRQPRETKRAKRGRERERKTRESTVKEPTATKTEGNKDEGSEPPRSACCIDREVHRSLEIIIIAADNECCRRQFDIRRR